jgi:aspartyl-tRNA(Asn)/glutamyl-tRNA(Gln) amidotransferase subunit C
VRYSVSFDIEHMATLARLKLTADEKERLSNQMGTILEYIEKLNELNTDNVEPTAHVLGLNNVFREDEPLAKPLADHNPISDSPAHSKGHYEVPKVL